MRILFVCKRSPQNRDLITRPYGRFHHIPSLLAGHGHEVRVALCSHRRLPSVHAQMSGVTWTSHDVRTLGPLGLLRELETEARGFGPDWVVSLSDTYYGWIAQRLARMTRARLAIDAYDDYEAYMPWNLPLHLLWRRALGHADLVTAAGPQLAETLQPHCRRDVGVDVLPMAADPEFMPMDKRACRHALDLAPDLPMMGYIGSWTHSRGTPMLLEAFRRARAEVPDLRLVLSGRPPDAVRDEPGVLCTGYVDDDKLPQLVNALDVACIVTADTRFGRSSYPAKLCEAMACKVPVVASSTAPVRWMLDDDATHLSPVGDATAFASRVVALLRAPKADYGPRPSWPAQAGQLDHLMRARAGSREP